jgi:hypothetical protein
MSVPALAATRLRHIASPARSSKRYLNIELRKKPAEEECHHRLSQSRTPLSSNQCAKNSRHRPAIGRNGTLAIATGYRQSRGARAPHHQRTISGSDVKQATLLKVVDEERRLPERRLRCFRVPFHMRPPVESVCRGEQLFNQRLNTHAARDHLARNRAIRRCGESARSPSWLADLTINARVIAHATRHVGSMMHAVKITEKRRPPCHR